MARNTNNTFSKTYLRDYIEQQSIRDYFQATIQQNENDIRSEKTRAGTKFGSHRNSHGN